MEVKDDKLLEKNKMGYTLVTDDSFQRVNTSVGSGTNSTTGVGNGWVDFEGNLWSISSDQLINSTNFPGTNVPFNCLYRQSSENSVEGFARAYFSNGYSCGCVARFTPANGGSGYSAFLYNGSSWFIQAAVNGASNNIATAVSTGGVSAPADPGIDLILTQINSTTTQITVNLFSQSAPNTPLATYTLTDTTPELQNVSGAMGVVAYGNGLVDRVQTYDVNYTLSSGTISTGRVFKTVANLSALPANGGHGTVSYQWYVSGVSGQLGTAISGATSYSQLTHSGLSADTTYYYTLVATDQSSPIPQIVNYPQTSVTTLPANGYVFQHIGDSITAGTGSTALDAADTEIQQLNLAGYHCQTIVSGFPGQTSGYIAPGGDGYTTILANSLAQGGAEIISIMIGTNDSNITNRYSPSTYQAYLSADIVAYFANIPTLQKVILNYPPFVVPNNTGSGPWDSTSDTLLQEYETVIDSLCNGDTVLQGDKTAYTFFEANQDDLVDGTHPNQTGHTWLGTAWATAFKAALPLLSVSPGSMAAATGATLTAGASGGTSPYIYSWSGTGITFNSTTVADPTAIVAASGTYTATVSVTDAVNNTSTESVTFSVTFASLNSNPVQNEYPIVLLNGNDPGSISQVDQMIYKYNMVSLQNAPVTIELVSPYANSEIRYETNGSIPRSYSKLYNGPLVFNRNGSGSDRTVIQARIYSKRNSNVKGRIIRLEFNVI